MFNYDIDINNYLDQNKIYNLNWRIVGPTDPTQPITELLVDFFSYPDNGTVVEFAAAPFLIGEFMVIA